MSDTPHPLFARLVTECGATWLDSAGLDAFLAQGGEQVILLAGNPVRFPEGLDVAVVLPELNAHFGGQWHMAIATTASEDAIARRYGAQQWPSLIFLRDGQYVETVAGMLDWDVYLTRIGALRQQAARRAPGIGIAVVAAGAGTSASACGHNH
ncbi:hydrogenase [Amphibiibacter pelophylacis]|uniref:Hydrogenase n=1 Tax=Amphibiibacter pelophylacis TaxID=1799477 RepID=A0ACC6P051_9BURK